MHYIYIYICAYVRGSGQDYKKMEPTILNLKARNLKMRYAFQKKEKREGMTTNNVIIASGIFEF